MYLYDPIDLQIARLNTKGLILDVGGGGEGIIGRIHGSQVVSIDICRDELIEAPAGPLKIQMDTTKMGFLDAAFGAATFFFSLMYMPTRDMQRQALTEALRVVRGGGEVHVWDGEVARQGRAELAYAIQLNCDALGESVTTAYGAHWPTETRDVAYYIDLCTEVGSQLVRSETVNHVFHLAFVKPRN